MNNKLSSDDIIIIDNVELKDFEENDLKYFKVNIDFSTDKSFVNREEKENK